MDRGDVGLAIYLVANVAWSIAAFVDLGGIYAIADVVCVVAAALLLAGWRLARPGVLLGGAFLTLACQGPFYARGFSAGPLGVIAQSLFVASMVAVLAAGRAWSRGEGARARVAMRVAGWIVVLDGAAFLFAEGDATSIWQIGNLLSGVAGVPLMIAGRPREAGAPLNDGRASG